MKKIEYLKAYNFVGHPVLETRAQFRLPTRFGDEVVIESSIVACGRTSFKVEHRLTLAGTLAAEGAETRVWAGRHPDDPKRDQIAANPTRGRCAFDAGLTAARGVSRRRKNTLEISRLNKRKRP